MKPPPTLYFIAGELSGDTHGAALLRALRERAPDLVFAGRGGSQMRAIAGDALENWTDQAAVVGLWEVLKNYGWFRAQMRRVLVEISAQKPAAVVLIDYPGFNLRLAKSLRRAGYAGKLIYYISPQVWAWHRGRIPQMARLLDLMICIFPFEKTLYEKSGLPTVFAGHPLLEQLAAERLPAAAATRDPHLIGLFPGSRRCEVRKIFPALLAAALLLRRERPHLRFAVPAASAERAVELRALRTRLAPDWTDAECAILPPGESRRLMQTAAAGLVASGTATVEAAYFGLPLAIVYRVAALTWWVGRAVVRVPFIGMINLLAGREIAREFLQAAAQPAALAAELRRLLDDTSGARTLQARELRAVIQTLRGSDSASPSAAANAADALLTALGPAR